MCVKQASAGALLDVTYGVEEAYFAVHAAKAVLKASEDAYARAKEHSDLARSGVGSGMRPPIELTRADADLARFDAARIRAEGGVTMAQAVFAAVVGVPGRDARRGQGSTDGRPTSPSARTTPWRKAERARLRASCGAPLAEIRAAEKRARAIAAEMRPNVYATGTISGRAGGATPSSTSGDVPSGAGWLPERPQLGRGPRPLLAALRSRHPCAHGRPPSRAASRRFEAQGEIASGRLRRGRRDPARRTSRSLVARAALPRTLQQSLDAARANWSQADARFRAGLGTAVELRRRGGLPRRRRDSARARRLRGRAHASRLRPERSG